MYIGDDCHRSTHRATRYGSLSVMIATARLTELPDMGLYPTLHNFPVTVKSGFIGILILPLFLLKLFSSCMYLKHFHQSLNVKQTLTNVE
jgi:hypothetical protein